VRSEVTEAWRLLITSGGAIRAGQLAAKVGWSARYLQRQLLSETGLTPRSAARVIRFDRARRRPQRAAGTGRPPSLARLAAGCGYYDQAHLAREFRELAGAPPSAWLAEEFRNVQASPDAAAEGC
jgi:AraC-like DNA-binding protein